MVAPSIGEVVLLPFPFSDLSQTKVRPAVCLAAAGRGDWIFCQITSSPYGDAHAVSLGASDFASGGLKIHSYARPGKLFTADVRLLISSAGSLHAQKLTAIVDALVKLVRPAHGP